MFYLHLKDLETLRGRQLSFTTRSLNHFAKLTITPYVGAAADWGVITAIENYADYLQMMGLCFTNEFKNWILLQAIEHSSFWYKVNSNMASYLLEKGADPHCVVHGMSVPRSGVLVPGLSFDQHLSSIELLVSRGLDYMSRYNSPLAKWTNLPATLEQFHRLLPDLGRTILYAIPIKTGKEDEELAARTIFRAIWEIPLASILQAHISAILLGDDGSQVDITATLVLFGRETKLGNFAMAAPEEPCTYDLPLIDLPSPSSGEFEYSIIISKEAFMPWEKITNEDKGMNVGETNTWLQLKGYRACLRNNRLHSYIENIPPPPRTDLQNRPSSYIPPPRPFEDFEGDPFYGFKKYYTTQPTHQEGKTASHLTSENSSQMGDC